VQKGGPLLHLGVGHAEDFTEIKHGVLYGKVGEQCYVLRTKRTRPGMKTRKSTEVDI